MTAETNKEKWYKRLVVAIFSAIKHPLISAIIGGVVVTIIGWFFGINPLENKIQVQNTMIQQQNITIQKLEKNIVSFKSTIQEQNTIIQSSETKIENLEQNMVLLKNKIVHIEGNVFNAPVKAEKIVGKETK